MAAPTEEVYFKLPPYTRPITTTKPEAQTWCEYGLTWSYSFNHAESTWCFEKAIAIDPECAMAHWGLAYSIGPNYNKPWNNFDDGDLEKTLQRSHEAVRKAKSLAPKVTAVEQGLINALQYRYPNDQGPKDALASWNLAYARAMKTVHDDFPDDLDVAALYADALMNLTPWALWDLRTGEPGPGSQALEVQRVLERALAQDGGHDHAGLLHFYVHLTEMSTEPERALVAADNLRRIAADAGHLSHMPSHLDILIGDYRRAMAANAEALRADAKFVARRGDTGFYSVYRMHNYHSLIYAAMFAGQFKVAIAATDEMEVAITEDQLRIQSPPMADWLEVFCAVRPHVLIRFGRWQDIKDLPLPLDQDLYCVTTATLHYAKGVAWAATGDVAKSTEERELFLAAKARVPETRMDYPNRCVDILAVAEAMLDGELEYRRGDDVEAAFALLRRAVELDDGLVYSEPWPWMQPARHALAALLLEQGRVGEAAEVYRADLGLNDTLFRARHHPNNIWALHGYHECAVRLGLHGEARIIQQQLKTALAFADVPIVSSCYCRQGEIQDGSGSQVNSVDKCH
ncbi:hypothetical protein QBC33DRAFT_582746 [Phialemonium atrogriseum]|uniref:TPR domain protein n=1 Tax=Phialemonium atrogriseum TaxID=1093897 RepID=A0AAJ0FLJ2_9PEZI|nr:uncharacterized protein QBC33DRAFT_582746 [Phialemonium atrogriseum]KAK1772257.1 hypothetical protein QBC33DRAFT_582746 [Phialemonium atrogriseum]